MSCPPAQSLPNEMLSAKTLKFVFFGENKTKQKNNCQRLSSFCKSCEDSPQEKPLDKPRMPGGTPPWPSCPPCPNPESSSGPFSALCSSGMRGNSGRHPQVQYPRWHLPMKKIINRCPFQARVPSSGRKIPIYYSFIKKRKRVTKQLLPTCLHTRYWGANKRIQ